MLSMPRRKKPLYSLTLNGLSIDVMSKSSLTIHDPMGNLEDGEALQICKYLYDEGFLTKQKNREIQINIVNS
jgi:hypothetical protein